MTKQSYVARADGWVAGRRVLAGDTVRMTEAQAKYEPVDPVDEVADRIEIIGIDLSSRPDETVTAMVLPHAKARRKGGK